MTTTTTASGTGVYFFEDGLTQARAWAERAHPGEPAVVQADVRLEDCIDLKNSVGWVPVLAQAHDELLRTRREQGVAVPRQTSREHRLDREVVELTVAILERAGMRIRSVRGVFAEGPPAFPGSFLSEGSHVQVAVRDAGLISDVHLVPAHGPSFAAHAAFNTDSHLTVWGSLGSRACQAGPNRTVLRRSA